jgi:hypothetical protein
MKLEISVFGLLIIAFYSAVVLVIVALPMRKLMAAFRWKWVVIAPPVFALLALPWAEEIWIAWHFEKLCRGAGVHVARQVEVEGFVDDTSRSSRTGLKPGLLNFDSNSLAAFDKAGYRYKEHMLADGGVWHVERKQDGVYGSVLDRPTARYHYRYAYQPTPHQYEEPVGWKLEKLETQVVDTITGEVIGRQILIKRRSSVAERLWIKLLGSDLTMCPDPEHGPRQAPFPEAVLKAATRN